MRWPGPAGAGRVPPRRPARADAPVLRERSSGDPPRVDPRLGRKTTGRSCGSIPNRRARSRELVRGDPVPEIAPGARRISRTRVSGICGAGGPGPGLLRSPEADPPEAMRQRAAVSRPTWRRSPISRSWRPSDAARTMRARSERGFRSGVRPAHRRSVTRSSGLRRTRGSDAHVRSWIDPVLEYAGPAARLYVTP